MNKIRVLVADDHAMIRMGLVSLLGTVNSIEVVGEAENGAEALAESQRLKPDIVLMDIVMPKQDGVEATAGIKAMLPSTRVILLTSAASSDTIARGIQAGAFGAIHKSADLSALVATIQIVYRGDTAISPEIQKLLREDPPVSTLSTRQNEILQSIINGYSDRDIALALGISVYTVKEHVKSLFAKIGAANRAEAVAIALRKHLLKM